MGQLGHLARVDKVVISRWNVEEVRRGGGGGRLAGHCLLLLSHARQLKGDLLLVDAETPDAPLLRESALVLQPSTLATDKKLGDGGEEVFVELGVLGDVAVRDAEAGLPSQPLSLRHVVHRGKDVAVALGGEAVVALHTGLVAQTSANKDRGAAGRGGHLVDASGRQSQPTIVARGGGRAGPRLLARDLREADY